MEVENGGLLLLNNNKGFIKNYSHDSLIKQILYKIGVLRLNFLTKVKKYATCKKHGFKAEKIVVEIFGNCRKCH